MSEKVDKTESKTERTENKKRVIISIGRQYCSHGKAIGRLLAERLNIAYYDKELLARIAEDNGFAPEIVQEQDERPTKSLLYSIVMNTFSYGYPATMSGLELPMNQKLFLAQFSTIREIAKEGSCVIMGRCADYALAEDPDLFRVFLHASDEYRVELCAKVDNLSPAKAKDYIHKMDKTRSSYYHYYTDQDWGYAPNYDLSINVSQVGIEGSVELILTALQQRGQQ